MRAESGFALVLVLWALILLTTIGMAFGFAVRTESASGLALSESVKAEAIATAGVRRAILGLLLKDREARWRTDGRTYVIPWADAALHASIRAENGKIDINYAQQPLLEGLFELLLPDTEPQVLAAAVLDWRDRDDTPRTEGAEQEDYEAVGRRGPTNAPFASIEELAQVLGFDSHMLEQLRPYVTVYGRNARVNAVSAGVRVIAAIPGISTEIAEQFVNDRDAKIAEGEGKDEDETPDFSLLSAGDRYLDKRTNASLVNIRASARLAGGASAIVEAVVLLGNRGKPYEILDWVLPPSEPPVREVLIAEQ